MQDLRLIESSIPECDVDFIDQQSGGWFVNTFDKHEASSKKYRETRDCTVRAFADAFNTTYERAHEHLEKKMGRIRRRGIVFEKCFEKSLVNTKVTRYEFKGHKRDSLYRCSNKNVSESSLGRITLGKFIETYGSKGNWIVLVRGHAVAVKNGVLYDYCYKPRRHVTFAFEVHV